MLDSSAVGRVLCAMPAILELSAYIANAAHGNCQATQLWCHLCSKEVSTKTVLYADPALSDTCLGPTKHRSNAADDAIPCHLTLLTFHKPVGTPQVTITSV